MAKCNYCGKRQVSGNKVSHSNIKTRTKNNPNIQRLKAVVGKKLTRVSACTRCIRSGKVTRPTPRSAQKNGPNATPAPAAKASA